ncbi:MAG: BtrH N-terminal domain-containing protein [Candidatus Bathyarchaeota archaeon]|nr:MAG: BtrH N-terminal domain-containing protein [Candidatus Bathyarchaeota archaeon]
MPVAKLGKGSITPIDNCPALDGYHCQTNSLAKIFHYYNCPLSEEMLFGLGAGMGFMYWHQKGVPPFIGGRGNVKNFFQDLGERTSVKIELKTTSSEKKAERILLERLLRKEPVMVYGDMGFLPWFDLPEEYHFGGHTFVICGYDGEDTVLASDMDQKASGLKSGFYYPIMLEQLRKARSSPYKPFPPKNAYLEFDFSDYHPPRDEDIYSSISQTAHSMLNPPISNFGIKGIRRSAEEITRWPSLFDDRELRLNLFTVYIFIEIGGTGGGCFRYMYSRFLREAAEITSNKALEEAASMILESGKRFSEIGQLFVDAETAINIEERIGAAKEKFLAIADMEEEAFQYLAEHITTSI